MNSTLKDVLLSLITIALLATPTYGWDLKVGKRFPPEFSTLGNQPCVHHQRVPDLVDLVKKKAKNR